MRASATFEREGWNVDAVLLMLIGAVIGAVVTLAIEGYVRRPNIQILGSADGGSPDAIYALDIANERRWFGIRAEPSTLLGKRIHGRILLGMPLETRTARHVAAWVEDPDSKELVLGLPLSSPIGSIPLKGGVDLACGDRARICVLAQDEDRTNYFFWQPMSMDDPTTAAPPATGRLQHSRTFRVRVQDNDARKLAVFKYEVRKLVDGRFEFISPVSRSHG